MSALVHISVVALASMFTVLAGRKLEMRDLNNPVFTSYGTAMADILVGTPEARFRYASMDTFYY